MTEAGAIELPPQVTPHLLRLLPLLEKLSSDPNEEISEMAQSLRLAVITRDPSWQDEARREDASAAASAGTDLADILAELRDPVAPIHAHALTVLRKV